MYHRSEQPDTRRCPRTVWPNADVVSGRQAYRVYRDAARRGRTCGDGEVTPLHDPRDAYVPLTADCLVMEAVHSELHNCSMITDPAVRMPARLQAFPLKCDREAFFPLTARRYAWERSLALFKRRWTTRFLNIQGDMFIWPWEE
jgi:hypothetical protein